MNSELLFDPTHTHHGTDAHSQHTDTNTRKITKGLTLALPDSLNLLNDDLSFLILYLKYFVPCVIFLLCWGFLRAKEIAVHSLGLWLQLRQGTLSTVLFVTNLFPMRQDVVFSVLSGEKFCSDPAWLKWELLILQCCVGRWQVRPASI